MLSLPNFNETTGLRYGIKAQPTNDKAAVSAECPKGTRKKSTVGRKAGHPRVELSISSKKKKKKKEGLIYGTSWLFSPGQTGPAPTWSTYSAVAITKDAEQRGSCVLSDLLRLIPISLSAPSFFIY